MHRVYFLEAELSLAEGNLEKGLVKFQLSSHFAEQEGAIEKHAFAAEHAGMVLLKHGRTDEGRQLLLEAKDLYERWGATIKVDQINSMLSGC